MALEFDFDNDENDSEVTNRTLCNFPALFISLNDDELRHLSQKKMLFWHV